MMVGGSESLLNYQFGIECTGIEFVYDVELLNLAAILDIETVLLIVDLKFRICGTYVLEFFAGFLVLEGDTPGIKVNSLLAGLSDL